MQVILENLLEDFICRVGSKLKSVCNSIINKLKSVFLRAFQSRYDVVFLILIDLECSSVSKRIIFGIENRK